MSAELETVYTNLKSDLSKVGRTMVLVAVSKGQSLDKIRLLYDLGHRDFGENYVQELLEKHKALAVGCPEIRWHFLGHLQTNKIKQLLPYVACIHAVESEKQIAEIEKQWVAIPACGKISVFVSVRLSDESTKFGALPHEVGPLVARIAKSDAMECLGLMCIPKQGESASSYQALQAMELGLRLHTQGMLSMGMSDDYPIALKYGATHIRVGTALFGARQMRPA